MLPTQRRALVVYVCISARAARALVRPSIAQVSSFLAAVFFVSFILLNGFILFNVFVAVLLDKMMAPDEKPDCASVYALELSLFVRF